MSECREHYLEGAGEAQFWICENDIIRDREDKLYVDLHYWDDTGYQWNSPKIMEEIRIGSGNFDSPVVKVVRGLFSLGITTPDALRIVGTIWRGLSIDDTFDFWTLRETNLKTLRRLEQNGLLRVKLNDPICQVVQQAWFYPLFLFDLRRSDDSTPRAKLQEQIKDEEQRWYDSII